jgi:hypothetical protein
MDFGKSIPYDINVKPTTNKGFIVKVGCATLAFSDSEGLLQFLREYLANPEKVEKEYNEANGNRPVAEAPVEGCPDVNEDRPDQEAPGYRR